MRSCLGKARPPSLSARVESPFGEQKTVGFPEAATAATILKSSEVGWAYSATYHNVCHFHAKLDTILNQLDTSDINVNVFQIKASFLRPKLGILQYGYNKFCSRKI